MCVNAFIALVISAASGSGSGVTVADEWDGCIYLQANRLSDVGSVST
jgi:hypothetical protein